MKNFLMVFLLNLTLIGVAKANGAAVPDNTKTCVAPSYVIVSTPAPNFDGSCSYSVPRLSIDGRGKFLYFNPDTNNTQTYVGFCAVLGKEFVQARASVEIPMRRASGTDFVLLNSEGKFVGYPNETDGSFVISITCR